jgi:hypothetical protein
MNSPDVAPSPDEVPIFELCAWAKVRGFGGGSWELWCSVLLPFEMPVTVDSPLKAKPTGAGQAETNRSTRPVGLRMSVAQSLAYRSLVRSALHEDSQLFLRSAGEIARCSRCVRLGARNVTTKTVASGSRRRRHASGRWSSAIRLMRTIGLTRTSTLQMQWQDAR